MNSVSLLSRGMKRTVCEEPGASVVQTARELGVFDYSLYKCGADRHMSVVSWLSQKTPR